MNAVVAGSRYDLDLENATDWIDVMGVQSSEASGSA